jgi:hypothetical protein
VWSPVALQSLPSLRDVIPSRVEKLHCGGEESLTSSLFFYKKYFIKDMFSMFAGVIYLKNML